MAHTEIGTCRRMAAPGCGGVRCQAVGGAARLSRSRPALARAPPQARATQEAKRMTLCDNEVPAAVAPRWMVRTIVDMGGAGVAR